MGNYFRKRDHRYNNLTTITEVTVINISLTYEDNFNKKFLLYKSEKSVKIDELA